MSWIIVVPFFAFGVYTLLFLSLIQRLRETVAGRIFAAILLVSACWAFFSWMAHIGAPPSPRFWIVTSFAFAIPLSSLMVHFATEYPRHKSGTRWLVASWYGLGLFLEITNLWGKIVERVELIPNSGGLLDIRFGPLMSIVWPYMILSIFLVAGLFAYSYRSTNSRLERVLMRYPLAGTALIFGGGLLNSSPALRGYPFDFLANISFALLIAYAISRHQFLNIRVLLRRNLAYIILFLTLSAGFIFVLRLIQAYVSGASGFYLWLMMAPLAGTSVLIFYIFVGRLQAGIDRLFFGKSYDYRNTLLELSQKIGNTLQLDKLAKDFLKMLSSALGCDKASLLLHSAQGDSFEVKASHGFSEGDLSGDMYISSDDSLLIMIIRQRRPLSRAEVEIMAGPMNMLIDDVHWLEVLSCEVVCPLMIRDNLVGLIALSHKKSGEHYSDEDLLLLSTISPQVAIAFDNARLYSETQQMYVELKQTHEGLVRSEKLRALGQMASGVAHDFNNILGTILTRAELALDKAGTSAVRDDLEVIRITALDGAQVTKRVQEFAKSPTELEAVPVDVNEVVKSAISMIEYRVAELQQTKGIFLEIIPRLHSRNNVLGNAADLKQALCNLAMNAIDAIPGDGRIEIATEDKEGLVCLSVSDTGIGMDAETREGLFQPFFTTKGERYSGLGLTVVEQIIQRHKGRIEVDSQPGKGSTFRILLSAATGLVAPPSTATKIHPMPQRGKVLVIDDDLEFLESLHLNLTQLGYEIASATNGSDGLAMAQRMGFDLVITDLGMPGMGGADTAICMKDINPDMPVLLITGWGVQIDSGQMKKMKVDGVLSKPFTRAQLAGAVNKLLK